jgi:hypothetical protein
MTPSPYAEVMGDRYAALAPALQRLHAAVGVSFAGEAEVAPGPGLGRLVARLFGLPRTRGRMPLQVRFEPTARGLVWARDFGGERFASRIRRRNGMLSERFGPIRFFFDLQSRGEGLAMRLRAWRMGPLPLPLALAPRIEAAEWQEAGFFRFRVSIRLPLLGPVVEYGGWLRA